MVRICVTLSTYRLMVSRGETTMHTLKLDDARYHATPINVPDHIGCRAFMSRGVSTHALIGEVLRVGGGWILTMRNHADEWVKHETTWATEDRAFRALCHWYHSTMR